MKKYVYIFLSLLCLTVLNACNEELERELHQQRWTPSTIVLEEGCTYRILDPDGSDTIEWTNDNPSAASVDENGFVTALKEGETTIKTGTVTVFIVVIKHQEECLPGVFSVSDTKKVRFSRGNLQATYHEDSRSYSWAIADYQYDIVWGGQGRLADIVTGNNTIGSQTDGARVDLFGWTKDGLYDDGARRYGINDSKDNSDYATSSDDDCCDWGKTIDGNENWRLLTSDEWKYLLETRSTSFGPDKRYTYVYLATRGVYGLMIFPDHYIWPSDIGTQTFIFNRASSEAHVDDRTFYALLDAGAVFLPAAGIRGGSVVLNNYMGAYWSTTPADSEKAHYMCFSPEYVLPQDISSRSQGCSVRLVKECE